MDKIICVGKNYLDHAQELGDAVPEMPVLFFKPPSSLAIAKANGETLKVPFASGRGALHHECEIVVRLGKGGRNLSTDQAEKLIESVTIGLDMTLRDLQSELKKKGHPWEMGKVFDGAAIVGPWVPAVDFEKFEEQSFTLKVDGQRRQQGNPADMRLSIAECIAYASEYFTLCEGDLLFSGTPAGVGPVTLGQTAELSWGPIQYSVLWT